MSDTARAIQLNMAEQDLVGMDFTDPTDLDEALEELRRRLLDRYRPIWGGQVPAMGTIIARARGCNCYQVPSKRAVMFETNIDCPVHGEKHAPTQTD